MNLPDIFSSPDSIRAAFECGLERQLDDESLGTFILVLANALFDDQLFSKFKLRLEENFEQKKNQYSSLLRQGKHLPAADDDSLVFLKLIAMGFDRLRATEYRNTEHWVLQFNQLRSLRPARMSDKIISSLSENFDEAAFHFNKAFLDKEIFWSGDINGVAIKLFYNKFPFVPLHGLLVPEPDKNLPQLLNSDMHNYIYDLCQQISIGIPNIGIAYNSYGAGASINHLHFQTFTQLQPLPVLKNYWQHNGGDIPYPTSCKIFDNSTDAWTYIYKLHQNNITYNLVYLADSIICLARKYQGTYEVHDWAENYAWYELCGGITAFNQDDFQNLCDEEVSAGLSAIKV